MGNPYIVSARGIKVDLINPRPSMFHILDIATGLSRMPRYTGQIGPGTEASLLTYSVAEHSVLLSEWCSANNLGADVEAAALLHDASEAYLCDIPGPLKDILPDYREVEARFEHAIRERFGVKAKTAFPELDAADSTIRLDEFKAVRPNKPYESDEEPLGIEIYCWGPHSAHTEFMYAADRLGIK